MQKAIKAKGTIPHGFMGPPAKRQPSGRCQGYACNILAWLCKTPWVKVLVGSDVKPLAWFLQMRLLN